MSKSDQAGKAALLAELLGESRVADWQRTGVLPKKSKEKADAASVAWHRNRLIEKFRERGLIPSTAPVQSPKPPQAPKAEPKPTAKTPSPDFSPGGLGARLAKHLDPERLADEHPAVIALFLRSQTAQLRSQVLRGLPGAQARAVMRILRGGSGSTKPKPAPRMAVTPPPKAEESEPDSEEPRALPPKPARTRRAL